MEASSFDNRATAFLGSANTISGKVLINDGGALDITGSSNAISGTAQLSFGGGSSAGPGVLEVTGPSNSITGGLYVNGGVLTISGTSLDLTGPDTLISGGISASSGGSVNLTGLTALESANNLSFSAKGSGSKLDISNLSSISGTSISITEINGAELSMDDSAFTTLDGVSFTIDGTSDLANLLIGNLTALTDGGLTVLGGTYTFSSLADIDGTSLDVENGASLSLPGVTGETNSTGVPVRFTANGLGSTLDISKLSSFSGTNISITEINGAELSMDDSAFTTLDGVSFTIDGTSDLANLLISNLTALTDGGLTVLGGTYTFSNLADIDNSGVSVSGGGSVSLPAVTSFTGDSYYHYQNGQYYYGASLFQVTDTTSGGTLNLPNLASIGGYYGASIEAAGSKSQIDLPKLTTLSPTYSGYAALSVTQGATVDDGGLTSLTNIAVTLDGTGTLAVSQWITLTNGSLTITGGDYAPTSGAATSGNAFTNLSDIDGSGLYVSGGGSLSLPAVTSFTGNTYDHYLNGQYVYGAAPFQVTDTTSGGTLSLPNLTAIAGYYGASIEAAGSKSQIDLPKLTTVSPTYSGYVALSVTQGATVDDGGLTSLTNIAVTLDGTGTLAVSQWITLTNGSLTITGGDYAPTSGAATSGNAFTNLSDIDGSGLYVSGGGSLSLPAVTSFTGNSYDHYVNGQYVYGAAPFQVTDTTSGGTLSLPNLTAIAGYYGASIEAAGSKSQIDLPKLTTVSPTYSGYAALSVTQGATVDDGGLTSLTNIAVTLDGTGKLAVSGWTALTNGSLTIIGGDYAPTSGAATSGNAFTNLSDIDGSGLYVSGGGSLSLPAVTSFTGNSYDHYVNGQYVYGAAPFQVTDTTSGGTLSLPNLTAIAGYYGASIEAAGSKSQIDLPKLTTVSPTYSGYAALSVTQGATVDDGGLTSLTNIAVTLDGTGKLAVSGWTALTNGSLTIIGGDYAPTSGAATSGNAFTNLSDIDGSGLYVSGGGSLSLPAVTSFTGNSYDHYVNGQYVYGAAPFQVTDTTSGGTLSLPNLTAIAGYYGASIEAAGSKSQIDLPKLTTVSPTYSGYAALSVTQGATVDDGGLTSLTNIAVTLDGTGKLAVSGWTALTNGSLTIIGGDYAPTSSAATSGNAFTNLSDIDGSGLYVSGGGSLSLPAVTSFTGNSYDHYLNGQYVYGAAPFQVTDTTSGGTLSLPNLTAIAGYYGASIEAAGSKSQIDLPKLTTVSPTYSGYAALSVTQGATVDDGGLTSLTNIAVTLDGTGKLAVSGWTALTNGSLTIIGGDYCADLRRRHVEQRVHEPERHRRVGPVRLWRRQPDAARRHLLHQQLRLRILSGLPAQSSLWADGHSGRPEPAQPGVDRRRLRGEHRGRGERQRDRPARPHRDRRDLLEHRRAERGQRWHGPGRRLDDPERRDRDARWHWHAGRRPVDHLHQRQADDRGGRLLPDLRRRHVQQRVRQARRHRRVGPVRLRRRQPQPPRRHLLYQ